MDDNGCPVADVARLKAATETLVKYVGYWNSEIGAEQDKSERTRAASRRWRTSLLSWSTNAMPYVTLREATPRLHPDEIFGRLEAWAGGMANTTPTHKAAVLAVAAYLFDKCEILKDAQAVGVA
jgi:predicted component of type VI protein secretion system